jgi:ADP-heptose:LPS heptosyltransferase
VKSLTPAANLRCARRVLVSSPGGLGDLVHTLPALRAIQHQCPDAVMDVLLTSGCEALIASLPGIGRVLPIRWYGRPQERSNMLRQRWQAMRHVWRTGYDAFIDFSPCDRTQLFLLLSRAPFRLGIRSFFYGLPRPWLYTHTSQCGWQDKPYYRYLLDALADVGFERAPLAWGPALLDGLRPDPAFNGCIHVSPFAACPGRELPPERSAELIGALCRQYSQRRIVLSGPPAPREQQQLAHWRTAIAQPNLFVLPADCGLTGLLRVLSAAAVHIGPDTGSLHLATLAGAPSVSWFLNHESLAAWIPRGAQHIVLVSALEQSRARDHLRGIGVAAIMAAVADALARSPYGGSETIPDLRFFSKPCA